MIDVLIFVFVIAVQQLPLKVSVLLRVRRLSCNKGNMEVTGGHFLPSPLNLKIQTAVFRGQSLHQIQSGSLLKRPEDLTV